MKKTMIIVSLVLLAAFAFFGCEKSTANITSASPDTEYSIDSASCMGCGLCVDACPHNALQIVGGRAVIIQSKCQQCGECVKACPRDAIH
jgi:ferredoxin